MDDKLSDVLDDARELQRRAWEAAYVLADPETGQGDRNAAAMALRKALLPFRALLPEDWTTCGGCGDAMPVEAIAGHDHEAGALCRECWQDVEE